MQRSLTFLILLLFAVLTGYGQSPRTVEARLLAHLSALEKFSNYGGSGDQDKLESVNKALKADLVKFGRSAATLSYQFPRLKEKMFVSTSADGRFRIYSWDEETGGTMHDFDSVFQFKGGNGRVYSWTRKPTDEYDIGGFFHDVFQVGSSTGPIYLGISTFIGSTSLAAQSISAFRIRGNALNPGAKVIRTTSGLTDSISFQYDFFSVVDRPERPIKLFKFDAARQTFSFPVVIEDQKSPQGRVTDKLIRYRFNGSHFAKLN